MCTSTGPDGPTEHSKYSIYRVRFPARITLRDQTQFMHCGYLGAVPEDAAHLVDEE
jgi:hypothetical protein